MKRIFSFIFTLLALVMTGCSSKCHITGTVPNPNLNGKYIYLMAEDGTIREDVGIDSVLIEDNKFEFTTDKNMMCIIRIDWRYRYGTQDLLLVAEPGELQVTIDSVSSAQGTPGNDALQQWKQITEVHNQQYGQLISIYQKAHFSGDSITEKNVKQHADSIHNAYIDKTHQIADGLDEGPLKEFFYKLYPAKK